MLPGVVMVLRSFQNGNLTIADDEHEDEIDEQLPQGDLDVQLRVLVVLQHLPGCPHAWV